VLATADDESILGVPFYVMEFMHGTVITHTVPAALDQPEGRAQVADELIQALVDVHSVDWQDAGLEGFGKPTGYLDRQLRRFAGLWEHNKTRELPLVEELYTWLAENKPESPEATIVHGDFRLGNTMFADESPARLVAIFDWEMATIGDPLADLGYMTATWSQRDDKLNTMFDLTTVTHGEGFPARDELWRSTRSCPAARCRICAGTRRSRSGSRPCSWRATTSARSPVPPTTSTSSFSTRACRCWRTRRSRSPKRPLPGS